MGSRPAVTEAGSAVTAAVSESRGSVAASETASARSLRRSLSRTGSRPSRVRISAGGDGTERGETELSPVPEPAPEPQPEPVDYALEVAARPEDFPLVETRYGGGEGGGTGAGSGHDGRRKLGGMERARRVICSSCEG